MRRLTKGIVIFIAQAVYTGRFPIAPGTAGTLVGVLLFLAMNGLSPWAYVCAWLLIFIIGLWAAGRAEVVLGRKDHPSIVIDEIAGYLLGMFMLPTGWAYVVAGFALFRVFDVVKPFPLRRIQDFHGGIGIMLDDIGAGIYTNLALRIGAALLRG